jgi:hypothetical protein
MKAMYASGAGSWPFGLRGRRTLHRLRLGHDGGIFQQPITNVGLLETRRALFDQFDVARVAVFEIARSRQAHKARGLTYSGIAAVEGRQ